MSSKIEPFVKLSETPIAYGGVEYIGNGPEPTVLGALQTNIQESLDEIDILRGTLQYWEGRRPAANPREREMLLEAFRIMYGELLGLTTRMKELLNKAELPAGNR